jgi:SAM-dependent methyltransferase
MAFCSLTTHAQQEAGRAFSAPKLAEFVTFVSFPIMIDKLKSLFFDLEDLIFEKLHGLQLGGVITHDQLVTDDKASLHHATAYHAVWCRNLRELLAEAKKTGITFRNFTDIGSGKGKACFYASRKMDFEQITGIEFSKPLVDIAEKNRERFKMRNISFIHGDASRFRLPDGATLVFMFNPFDSVVLERFIENNLDHFKKHKSVIAYANDKHQQSLTAHGLRAVFRNPAYKISLYRYGTVA